MLGFSSYRPVVTFVKRISVLELHTTKNWPVPQDFLGMICNSPFCKRRDIANTVRTQIQEKCARTLELPLQVRRLVYSFCFVSARG